MMNFVKRERCPYCNCLRSPKKFLFPVWILRCISRLTSLFGVTKDPKYTNSLTTSKVLSPKPTLSAYVANRSSFPAAIMYFVLLSLIFILLGSFLFPHFLDGCLALTDNVDIIAVTKYLCLLVEYSAVRLYTLSSFV
jgi:hypothetical protein